MSTFHPAGPGHWQTVLCLLLTLVVQYSQEFACHPKCNCIWRNGKQTAECPALGMTEIPSGLDSGVQVLNFSRNNLVTLQRDAFLQANIVNLQRIYLSKCNIEQVDEYAFNRVSNLIDLDLSDNRLSFVPSSSFRHLPLLRHLTLNGNLITTLTGHAFIELKALTMLELSNCKIDTIFVEAFEGLSKLEVLKIDGNYLQTLSGKTMMPLISLHGISIDGNPWHCDCKLRSFRLWLDKNNVPNIPPTCSKPVRLKGKSWKTVGVEEFSCPPAFLNSSSVVNMFEGGNVTLECKAFADPAPHLQWVWRERIISNLSEGISSGQTFVVSEFGEKEKVSRLTITFVQEPNGGTYSCIVENNAGKVDKNFTLVVSRRPVTEVRIVEEENRQEVREEEVLDRDLEEELNRQNPVIGMIIGIIVGALIVLVIFGIVLFVCRRKRRRAAHRKRTDANHKVGNSVGAHITKDPQEDVDLKLLGVNPIQKPPRLGAYEGIPTAEVDQYEPVLMAPEASLVSPVWVVKDHVPSDVEWEDPQKHNHHHHHHHHHHPPLPVVAEKRHGTRSPIPVPMPVPQEDIHSRLHNELADTLKRKNERRYGERERGDGSSELETNEYTEGSGKPPPHYDTLRVRELDRAHREDEGGRKSVTPPLHAEEKTPPDLIDHPMKMPPQDPNDPGSVQMWDPYDHPSAYFRSPKHHPSTNSAPPAPAAQNVASEGGVDGTEV